MISNYNYFNEIDVVDMMASDSSTRFSEHTLDRAAKAKVTLETHYNNLLEEHKERQQRYDVGIAHTRRFELISKQGRNKF